MAQRLCNATRPQLRKLSIDLAPLLCGDADADAGKWARQLAFPLLHTVKASLDHELIEQLASRAFAHECQPRQAPFQQPRGGPTWRPAPLAPHLCGDSWPADRRPAAAISPDLLSTLSPSCAICL